MSDEQSILNQLAQDARIMRSARMLPTERALTPHEIEQVSRDFKRFCKENRHSMQRVSKALGEGFSPSVLSQFTNALYKGDCERVARAVNEWMERKQLALEVARPADFVETEVARDILTVVRTVVASAGIGVVVGPAGVGKTKTAEAAHRMMTGSILIRIMQGTRRGPGLCAEIASRLGVPSRSTLSVTQRNVVESLKGSNRPIFVDEAHELTETGLNVLRDLHDAAGVPLILFGTDNLRKNVDDSTMFFGQFNSRITARIDVTEKALHPKNPRPLFTVDEIMRVFSSDKLRLSKDGARFLCQLACTPGLGGLRLCAQIVTIAGRLPKYRGQLIDARICRGILKQMHGAAFLKLTETRSEQLHIKVA